MKPLEKEVIEHFQKRVSAPIKCIKTSREEYDLYMAERRQVINNRRKELMLQAILGKLGVSSMDGPPDCHLARGKVHGCQNAAARLWADTHPEKGLRWGYCSVTLYKETAAASIGACRG